MKLSRRNAMDMVLQSSVKEINREIFRKNRELRTKAGKHVRGIIKRNLQSVGSESTPGGFPAELTGNLKKGIGQSNRTFYTDVGMKKPAYHAWLVERGHDIIRNGVKVGEAQPRPFLEPAFAEAAPTIKRILSEQHISD